MGLFGGGYDKLGKGVDRNAPKKRGLFLYLELVTRKFSKFIGAGFLFFLLSIPLIILIYILSAFVFYQPISSLQNTALENMKAMGIAESEFSAQLGTIPFMICSTISILFLTLWGSGPLSAGLSYIFRCFTREEHVWIWSDGKDKIKENFKYGAFILIIDIILFILVPIALTFYHNLGKVDPSMNIICTFITYIMSIFLIIYTMMHPYIYQIMITFECSFKELLKNSFLLSIAKLPLNLLLTALSAFIIVLPASFFGVIGSMALAICTSTFGFIILRYPMEFYAARTIKKVIINNNSVKEKNTPKIVYDEEE